MASDDFLKGTRSLTWAVAKPPTGYTPADVYVGNDLDFNMPLEVAVAETTANLPTRDALARLHKDRLGNRGYALVVAALTADKAWLFGPNSQAALVGPLDRGQAQRLLQAALDEPNSVAAVNRLGQIRNNVESSQKLGVTNSGLFASHHLRENVPSRHDWAQACQTSQSILSKSGTDLIKALGFTAQKSSAGALLLSGTTAAMRVVAVLLDDSEQFEARADRYQVSPVAFGLKLAAEQDVPWLILLRGGQIRLYPAKDGFGVGQRGQSDTYFELDLPLLSDVDAGLLHLLFSAAALAPGGTTQQILADSAKYATDLGTRLKNRIYDHVVPDLAKAVAAQLPAINIEVDADGLQLAYRLTLRILFRLLFQAYAEDRGLLPFGRNPRYDRNALKTLVVEDLIPNRTDDFDSESQSLWDDLQQVWRVIDAGDRAWGVPAYNGGLFGSENELHPEGALIHHMNLTNDTMGPVLRHMLVDLSEDNVPGPVDFRSLSVREFGTIYEGLLESSLSLADQDLTVDSKGAWVPAKMGDPIDAPAGTVYFHSASGERKATGSYFTPSIIVEHLLDRALEPALEQHLARVSQALAAGDEARAHEIFFDFRVADLAMGSGHFLVAAVDRIETAMRNYLVDNSIPGVTKELIRLEEAAKEALGSDYEFTGVFDRAGLLRRQVARRCIYGLDINPLAVELSRLALWIHTFVPGLPMSSLDHGLVCANSLTGIGTIDEALEALEPNSKTNQISLFEGAIQDTLDKAKDLLLDAANAAEANKQEVKKAAEIAKRARLAAEPTKQLFDAAVAARLGVVNAANFVDPTTVMEVGASDFVQKAVFPLKPAHMPYIFPEVFLRENPGFDVLLGNPPWEELVYEEIKFWTLNFPGLKGKSSTDQKTLIEQYRATHPELYSQMQSEMYASNAMRIALMNGPFPGMGAGHADLYKAFSWRFLHLLASSGRAGIVLPRGALSAAGSEEWRRSVLTTGGFTDVAFLINNSGWIFPSVHPQYSVALICLAKENTEHTTFSGPFASWSEFEGRKSIAPLEMPNEFLKAWSSTAAFPTFASEQSLTVMKTMKVMPDFCNERSDFEFAPLQGDFNQTTDSKFFFVDDATRGNCLVYKGSSFNLWDPDAGEPHGSADYAVVESALKAKLQRQIRNSASALFGRSGTSVLPLDRARIAFRDITNQTNTRTLIACLVPPRTVLTNKAPYMVLQMGESFHEAFVLGVLSSIILDWYARRYVEISLNFHIIRTFPIPTLDRSSYIAMRLIEISGCLAAVDARYAEWAKEVGVPVASVKDEAVKNDMIAENDALVALLYGLSEKHIVHIFETFHRGWDYKPRLAAVLAHYADWKDKA